LAAGGVLFHPPQTTRPGHRGPSLTRERPLCPACLWQGWMKQFHQAKRSGAGLPSPRTTPAGCSGAGSSSSKARKVPYGLPSSPPGQGCSGQGGKASLFQKKGCPNRKTMGTIPHQGAGGIGHYPLALRILPSREWAGCIHAFPKTHGSTGGTRRAAAACLSSSGLRLGTGWFLRKKEKLGGLFHPCGTNFAFLARVLCHRNGPPPNGAGKEGTELPPGRSLGRHSWPLGQKNPSFFNGEQTPNRRQKSGPRPNIGGRSGPKGTIQQST